MKIVSGWKPITVFAKHCILDVWQGSEYTSAEYFLPETSQLTFTCSKSTIETLEKGVKDDQS